MHSLKLLIMAIALFPFLAAAELDFGPDPGGFVIADIGEDGRASAATDIVTIGGGNAPDLLVVGRVDQQFSPALALLRYTADGLLVDDFGQGGLVLDNLSDAGLILASSAAVLALEDGDGGLYVIGTVTAPSRTVIVRYDESGERDTSFGVNGVAVLDVSDGAAQDVVAAAVLDAEDRIVMAGNRSFATEQTTAAVWRVLPDGTRDENFADNGVWPGPARSPTSSAFNAVALRDGNGVIVGGTALQGADVIFDRTGIFSGDFVLQLDADGEPVDGFGEDGEVYILGEFDAADVVGAEILALALQGDRIVYAGAANYGAGGLGPGSFGIIDADTGTPNTDPDILDGGARGQLLPRGDFATGRDIVSLENGNVAVVGAGRTATDANNSALVTFFGVDADGDFRQLDAGELYRDISPDGGSALRAAVTYGTAIAVAGSAQGEAANSRVLVSRLSSQPPQNDNGGGDDGVPGNGEANPIGGGGSGSAIGGGAFGGTGLLLLGLLALGRLALLLADSRPRRRPR